MSLFYTGSRTYEQLNFLTAYLDASAVYGSTPEEEVALRQYIDGLLRIGSDNLPPIDRSNERMCMIPKSETDKRCYLGG